MKLHSPFAGPCGCGCHSGRGFECQSDCCYHRSVPRLLAKVAAARACEAHLNGECIQSVLEIKDHEHNLVTLSALTEDNGIRTLLKLTDLSPDCEERSSEVFMPSVRTVLECCASVSQMQALIDQSEEFRTIATVRTV